MSKIGRNDPCPCGSGKKYKHCCLKRAQEASGMFEAEADAFAERYNAVTGATGWLFDDAGRRSRILTCACDGDEELAGLVEHDEEDDELSRTARDGLLGEWALAEGIESCAGEAGAGVQAGFAGLVLKESGLRFPVEGRGWIQALEGSALSLYEVLQEEAGRLVVRDAVHGGEPEQVELGFNLYSVEPGAIAGLRLLPGTQLRRIGTGQFAYNRERGGLLAQWVKAELGRRRPDSPVRLASRLVLRGWLEDMYDGREKGLSWGKGGAGETA